MVLYRKFRPQKFNDIIGQEHIVQTLTNALAMDMFSHGYLFAGPRGTGKTTLARIFAKALNCSGRKLAKDSFEPCNKCLNCKEITLGKSLDLIEIDAASNRGIDEIRQLREKIRFAPTSGQYKIYIIDEVHMLTKEAFNALLKTLEEPPAHAVFIMATTEPHKVLPTIISRVQRFDFRRADVLEIKKLIKKVAASESIKIDDEAIDLLAHLSFGSYRDALSLLGQISSLRKTAASLIKAEQVQQILGLVQEKSVFDLAEFLAQKDQKKAFDLIGKLYLQGMDIENFTIKTVEILRKIALLKLGERQLFDLTKEQQIKIKELSAVFEINQLMSIIEKLALALPAIKAAPLPQLPLEMIVYDFTRDYPQPADLTENDNFKAGGHKTLIAEQDGPKDVLAYAPKVAETKSVSKTESPSRQIHQSQPESKINQNLWMEIIKEAKAHNHSLAALLKDAILAKSDSQTITLAFKFKFHADMISGKRNTQIIESIIKKITGSSCKVCCIVNPSLVIEKPIEAEEELFAGAKEVFEIEE